MRFSRVLLTLFLANSPKKNCVSALKRSSARMSTVGSAINADGTLRHYVKPTPTTPACIAASNGDTVALSTFRWTDLSAADTTGNNCLIWAADRGQCAAVELLLAAAEREDPASVNTRGYIGNTALARAARGGHVECVVALLARSSQINPNLPNDKKQYPLHFAAFKRHPAVVQALLASPLTDTTVTDRKGRTPAEDTSDAAIRDMILSARQRRLGVSPGPPSL